MTIRWCVRVFAKCSRNDPREVVAEAGDGREAVRLAEQLKPDVCILDVAMPLLNGIEATRQIARRVPTTFSS